MESFLFGITNVLIYCVFLTALSDGTQQCKPGFYLSVDLFYNCIDCPVSCDNQYEDDKEHCKQACGQTNTTTSKPLTQHKTEQNKTENNPENGYKTPNESRKMKTTKGEIIDTEEDSGLSERNQLAIIIGVFILLLFFLFTIVGVVLLMRNNRMIDLKSDEEENVRMCSPNSDSSVLSALQEHQESVEEPEVDQEATKLYILDSGEDCSSIMTMDETQF